MGLKPWKIYVDFEWGYVHIPTRLKYRKGHRLERRMVSSRGYMDLFIDNTWVVSNGSEDVLPNISLVVRKISNGEVHLAYGPSTSPAISLTTVRPHGEDPYVTISDTDYRAYYPQTITGQIVEAEMNKIFIGPIRCQ